MSFGWVWAIAVAVAGGVLMWQAGLKRKSLAGATFAMLFIIAGVVVAEPSLVEQLSLLMLGGAIAMMIGAFVLIGWMWNVVGLIKWRRMQRSAGRMAEGSNSMDEWLPWIAWYPVTTEKGTAWMRFVQVRMRAVAEGAANEVMSLEFREISSAPCGEKCVNAPIYEGLKRDFDVAKCSDCGCGVDRRSHDRIGAGAGAITGGQKQIGRSC